MVYTPLGKQPLVPSLLIKVNISITLEAQPSLTVHQALFCHPAIFPSVKQVRRQRRKNFQNSRFPSSQVIALNLQTRRVFIKAGTHFATSRPISKQILSITPKLYTAGLLGSRCIRVLYHIHLLQQKKGFIIW